MINAMMIDSRDNVAMVIDEVAAGGLIRLECDGILELRAEEAIPIYHKVAVREIAKGALVIKYGERIGVSTSDIQAGRHVHVHNVVSGGENE